MATDPIDLFNSTIDAYTQSVGHEPDDQEMIEIERVVAQEIHDNWQKGEK